jgi:hypothetical protein
LQSLEADLEQMSATLRCNTNDLMKLTTNLSRGMSLMVAVRAEGLLMWSTLEG